LTGLASMTEIILVVVGVGLLLIELFLIPGFGVAGILGLLLILAGLVMSFAPAEPGPIHWPRLEYTLTSLKHGLLVITGGMLASIIGGVALSRFLPKVPVLGRIVAPNPTAEVVRPGDPYGNLAQLGDIGVAEGILRPAGKARFGQVLVDVVSEGEFIQPDTRVEVVERHGNRVVGRKYEV
jgi:membrane-bound serine protease (ClpP class)